MVAPGECGLSFLRLPFAGVLYLGRTSCPLQPAQASEWARPPPLSREPSTLLLVLYPGHIPLICRQGAQHLRPQMPPGQRYG